MKYILLLLLVTFCLKRNNSFAQWSEIYSDSTIAYISDVKFLNKDTGFACGIQWPNPISGIILRTTNGGNSWDTTTIGIWPWLMSLSIVDDYIVYAGGQDGAIYKTVDGGNNWNWNQTVGGWDDLTTIHFINPDTGFIVKFSGFIWKTPDSSLWSGQLLGGHSYFPNTSSIQFINDSIGYVANEKLFKTTDCGVTWQTLNPDSTLLASCIYMRNSNDGIAVGLNGLVSRTMDGGITFAPPVFLGPYALYDCAFINDSVGYIVGGNDSYYGFSTTDYGIIFRTLDAGNTWDSIQSFDHSIISLAIVNDSIGYAAGQGGKIYKIINANAVGINDVAISKSAVSISPNPFNLTATLHVTSEGGSFLIFDMQSRLVRKLLVKSKTMTLNKDDLVPGIYMFQLINKDGSTCTGRFIIH